MRNTLIIGGLCIVAILVGGWLYLHPLAKPRTEEASPEAATPVNVPFKVLGAGTNAVGMDARKNYAIYDPAEFKTFWAKAHNGTTTAPSIDFSKEYVLAVFAGKEPTGDYAIEISNVTDTGASRAIEVTLDTPGPGCVTSQAVTSPYQFVSVPVGTSDTLTHTDTVVQKPCK